MYPVIHVGRYFANQSIYSNDRKSISLISASEKQYRQAREYGGVTWDVKLLNLEF